MKKSSVFAEVDFPRILGGTLARSGNDANVAEQYLGYRPSGRLTTAQSRPYDRYSSSKHTKSLKHKSCLENKFSDVKGRVYGSRGPFGAGKVFDRGSCSRAGLLYIPQATLKYFHSAHVTTAL